MIDWFFTTGMLLGVRGSFRMFQETLKRQNLMGQKVVIYGAGRGGELLLREILNNSDLNVNPVGFIDDDVLKKGKKIQGYPILGALADLNNVHSKHNLSGVVLSFSNGAPHHKQVHNSVKQFCQPNHLWLKQFEIELKDIHFEQHDD